MSTAGRANSERSLDSSTWTEVAERQGVCSVLVLPIGSCEQHGPHLPLSTDTVIATALCANLAERRDDVVIGPPIPIGNSGEHTGFAGTLSVSDRALGNYLLEIGRSAVATAARPADFSALLFVSGHGGNASALSAAAARLRSEGRPSGWWVPTVEDGDAHAGATETSVMLAIAPQLVRRDAIEVGATAPLGELMPAIVESGVRSVSANGVLGDPRAASAERGGSLFERWTTELEAAVEEFAN